MISKRAARQSQNAVQVSRAPNNVVRSSAALYSNTSCRPALSSSQCARRHIADPFTARKRYFSSSPMQRWSISSLWSINKATISPANSSSEFATSTSSAFAQYSDSNSAATRGTNELSGNTNPHISPTSEASLPAVVTSETIPPTHHGSPLKGPETLLPDPVTHQPVVDLSNPLDNIPEHIGYLKEVGLDYGWGTSSPMQTVLEYLHIYGGLPWYASSIVAALLVRLLFLRLQLKSSHANARWKQLAPLHEPLSEQLKAARLSGDSFKAAQLTRQLLPLRTEAKLSLPTMLVPVIGQVALGWGIWRNLRGMSELPIPALEHEKFLWISDLSLRDSTFILAFIQPISMYMVMGMNAEGANTKMTEMKRFQDILRRALPVGAFFIVAFQPAIVQIYFVTSTLLNLVITSGIKNKRFRSWAGLAQFPTSTPPISPRSGGASPSTTYARAAEAAGIRLSSNSAVTTRTSSSGSTAVSSTENVSSIDRMVNSVKSSFSSTFASAQSDGTKKATEKIAQTRSRKEKERIEQYEAQRKKELESDRTRRNEQAKRVFERERAREAELAEQERTLGQDDGEEVNSPTHSSKSQRRRRY